MRKSPSRNKPDTLSHTFKKLFERVCKDLRILLRAKLEFSAIMLMKEESENAQFKIYRIPEIRRKFGISLSQALTLYFLAVARPSLGRQFSLNHEFLHQVLADRSIDLLPQ